MGNRYTPKTWVNGETTANADNLNHIEQGIEALDNAIENIVVSGGAISPTITEAINTTTEYKLTVTDINGTFTTPNLIGPQGPQGSDSSSGTALAAVSSQVAQINEKLDDLGLSVDGDGYVVQEVEEEEE